MGAIRPALSAGGCFRVQGSDDLGNVQQVVNHGESAERSQPFGLSRRAVTGARESANRDSGRPGRPNPGCRILDHEATIGRHAHAGCGVEMKIRRRLWTRHRLGGEDGAHRYKLFNLAEDPGEQNDLSATFPDRVRDLDSKIDGFLADTRAVSPLRNPNFDPATYRPELEGIAEPRGSRPTRSPGRPSAGEEVAGWIPRGTCELSVRNGKLIVTSSGRDPHLSSVLPRPVVEESLILKMTMSSHSSGPGRLYWQEQGITPAFHRDRSRSFDVQHDGDSHEYAVRFSPMSWSVRDCGCCVRRCRRPSHYGSGSTPIVDPSWATRRRCSRC